MGARFGDWDCANLEPFALRVVLLRWMVLLVYAKHPRAQTFYLWIADERNSSIVCACPIATGAVESF